MSEPFTFKCLYCDRLTPEAATHEEAESKATASGWSWGKALVCPDCTPPETQHRLLYELAVELLCLYEGAESYLIHDRSNHRQRELLQFSDTVADYRTRLEALK